MIWRLVLLVMVLGGLTACNTDNQEPVGASLRPTYENEGKALQNAGCFLQDAPLCAHLVEKRTEFNLLLNPHTKNIRQSQKEKAQRILRNRLSEAGANINQCQKGDLESSIALFKGVKLRGEPVTVYGTKPLTENPRCFIHRHVQDKS